MADGEDDGGAASAAMGECGRRGRTECGGFSVRGFSFVLFLLLETGVTRFSALAQFLNGHANLQVLSFFNKSLQVLSKLIRISYHFSA